MDLQSESLELQSWINGLTILNQYSYNLESIELQSWINGVTILNRGFHRSRLMEFRDFFPCFSWMCTSCLGHFKSETQEVCLSIFQKYKFIVDSKVTRRPLVKDIRLFRSCLYILNHADYILSLSIFNIWQHCIIFQVIISIQVVLLSETT